MNTFLQPKVRQNVKNHIKIQLLLEVGMLWPGGRKLASEFGLNHCAREEKADVYQE